MLRKVRLDKTSSAGWQSERKAYIQLDANTVHTNTN